MIIYIYIFIYFPRLVCFTICLFPPVGFKGIDFTTVKNSLFLQGS